MDYYHNSHRQTLGDLPFLNSSHFNGNSNFWSWVGKDYERLQHLLHEQSQERFEIKLVSKYKPIYRQSERNPKIDYHADLLPRWNSFTNAHMGNKSADGLKRICIDSIVLPPSPYFEQQLLPILNEHTSLQSLTFSDCGLGTDDIACIAKFLNKNKSLYILDLSSNDINEIGARKAKALASAIKKHQELTFVNLSNCNLGENIDVLSALLDGCNKLQGLALEENGIRSEDGIALVAKFLSKKTALTEFSLRGNAIGNDNAKALGEALKKNTQLRSICLGSNDLDLPSILGSNEVTEHLTYIDLSSDWWIGIKDWSRRPADFVCEAGNKLKMPGVKLLAKYMKRNPALTELNLNGCGIPSKAAKILLPALKKNTTLQHLGLAYNSFNNNSVSSFVDALQNNTTLLTLDLRGNNIQVETGRKALLRGALCDTSSLESIATSNHVCAVTMTNRQIKNKVTNEVEFRNINTLDVSEGEKIRLKVVFAMFTLETDLFSPKNFEDLDLELMPRLLEIAQKELGFKNYGKGVVKRKGRAGAVDPTLNRIYEVVMGWNTPLLFIVSYVCSHIYLICFALFAS